MIYNVIIILITYFCYYCNNIVCNDIVIGGIVAIIYYITMIKTNYFTL